MKQTLREPPSVHLPQPNYGPTSLLSPSCSHCFCYSLPSVSLNPFGEARAKAGVLGCGWHGFFLPLFASFSFTANGFFLVSLSPSLGCPWLQSLRNVLSAVWVANNHGPKMVLLWQGAHPSRSVSSAVSPAITPAMSHPFLLTCFIIVPSSQCLWLFLKYNTPGSGIPQWAAGLLLFICEPVGAIHQWHMWVMSSHTGHPVTLAQGSPLPKPCQVSPAQDGHWAVHRIARIFSQGQSFLSINSHSHITQLSPKMFTSKTPYQWGIKSNENN